MALGLVPLPGVRSDSDMFTFGYKVPPVARRVKGARRRRADRRYRRLATEFGVDGRFTTAW